MASTSMGRAVRGFNSGVVALLRVPFLGPLMSKGFVEIEYVGRRSGRIFRTPVNFMKKGDEYVIGVAMPDKKTWWRNFLGEGSPILLHFREGQIRGHATARRDEKGRVTVRVRPDTTA
ncbi:MULTISPECIES: hypothetical protein [Nocardia]|uniref:hypothetical protein n=1 Tax=Nocardia TaxID=1817 RepID=UPI002455C6A5|nr:MULTISPECIES: hypothetical protein [Nocardia]